MTDASIQQEITRLEQARCRALVEADLDALDQLVSDDVVHVHATGHADDKAAYLLTVEKKIRFLSATREHLEVRVHGDVAIATGALTQSIELKESAQRVEMHVMTTQVWARARGAWQQVSFQATNI
ncbi:nuclear transport factor 2 family protein [Burkholderia sp. S171]|uniref:nuclear transport factor 2 family protein n=1 Tax=Burkholderia sp. S171 TaxID=1641860 RepID=UPI00131C0C4C|nr:nuclear transport factor 2 family protein [Burkholderia sp. S171]